MNVKKRLLLIVSLLAIVAVLAITYEVVSQKHTAQIIDCAPGYHNVAGPDSMCVKN